MIKSARIIRALVPLLHIYPWAIPAIVTLGLLSSLAEGMGISLFIPFLHSLEHTRQFSDTGNRVVDALNALFENIPSDRRLMVISIFIFGSILLRAVLFYSNNVLFGWLNSRINHRLRSGIFEHILRVNYRFFENSQSGKLLNILSNETWRTGSALSTLVSLIVTACTLAVYIAMMLIISWRMTLLVAVVTILISKVARMLTRNVRHFGEIASRANTELANRMIESFAGMKIIRAFGRESYEKDRFDRASFLVTQVFMKLGIVSGIVRPVYEVLAGLLLVFVMVITLRNPENLSAFLIFVFILYRLLPNVRALESYRVSLESLEPAVEEVTSILNTNGRDYILPAKKPYSGLKRAIFFDQATFHYNASERPSITDVSISIPVGKITALVGPSGAGKTTLIKLILGFYKLSKGEIYIDDTPLSDINLASWRRKIALVSQDVFIFNTTIRENITYGRLDAKEEEIISAAKLADAHEFISKLPQGYDSEVGDRGVKLSGGQQQRITLARAIVRNPEILILDEATNALDGISLQIIQKALESLKQNRTIIVIAHRLSSIEQADHIIVMGGGRVREQGDFQHLIKRNGLFARLYALETRKALSRTH